MQFPLDHTQLTKVHYGIKVNYRLIHIKPYVNIGVEASMQRKPLSGQRLETILRSME